MKIRQFAIYFWLILMFVFGGFGTFYLITGTNVLTGQSRNSVNVLPASTQSTNGGEYEEKAEVVESEDTEEQQQLSEELLVFNEIMAKTSNNLSFKLQSTAGNEEPAVFFRFGSDSDSSYLAVYASGLSEEDSYYAHLIDTEGESMLMGELKNLDGSGVLKLGELLEDYTIYSQAVLSSGSDLTDENYLFTADLQFEDSQVTPTPQQEE